MGDTGHSYDQVAGEYADHYFHELNHKPFDRELLERFASRVGTLGPICDMGCGPGQIARYLRDSGAEVLGIDRRTLYRMAERFGLNLGDDEPG